jgi:hypothetical protein
LYWFKDCTLCNQLAKSDLLSTSELFSYNTKWNAIAVSVSEALGSSCEHTYDQRLASQNQHNHQIKNGLWPDLHHTIAMAIIVQRGPPKNTCREVLCHCYMVSQLLKQVWNFGCNKFYFRIMTKKLAVLYSTTQTWLPEQHNSNDENAGNLQLIILYDSQVWPLFCTRTLQQETLLYWNIAVTEE